MNMDTAFAGTGMREISKEAHDRDIAAAVASQQAQNREIAYRAAKAAVDGDDSASDAFADAVSEVLEQQKEPVTDRGIFERSLAVRRAEKAKQQEIARVALAKAKQLTASIHSMEMALDVLLVSEA